MKNIVRFAGEYHFLSNFAASMITIDGMEFPTVEHAFQAYKMTTLESALRVRACATPGQAKGLARSLPKRADWEDIKRNVMYICVKEKFSSGALRLMLLDTEPAGLIEGNAWNDRYWGMVKRLDGVFVGENWLGKILMLVRKEIA
jgi:ribA/ribD-fused uncharacterized protein